MQEAALDILYFLDGLESSRQRRDMVLSAAVSAGIIAPAKAWPELFGDQDEGDPGAFPAVGADMDDFHLENATPESFENDIEAMVRASEHVTIREEDPPPFPRLPGLPDTEWT